MNWIFYLLQVNVYLVVFYGFYKLLLDRETYFTLNRIYLIAAGIFSLSIPFLRFEWFTEQPAVQPVYTSVVEIDAFLTEVTMTSAAPEFTFGQLMVLLYLSGAILFSLRFLLRLFALKKLLGTVRNGVAFSFFKRKVIDPSLPSLEQINRHEEVHMHQWHSLDVIFFELLGIIAWFNPVIYLYKQAAKSIHEYLADEVAAEAQGDREQYSLLLLSKAFGVPQSTLSNSFFNKSLIKKRIYMLHKQRSRKVAIFKYGLFLPLFAIALVMSSASLREHEEIKAFADELPSAEPIEVVKEAVAKVELAAKSASVTSTVETPIKSDWKAFYAYMQRNLRYPNSAHDKQESGYSVIKFTVTGGKLAETEVLVSQPPAGFDEETLRALKAFDNYASIPDGRYIFSTVFILDDNKANIPEKADRAFNLPGYTLLDEVVVQGFSPAKKAPSTERLEQVDVKDTSKVDANSEKLYDFATLDKQPAFPGGMLQFYKYIQETIKFPRAAITNKVNGKVFVTFVVEKDGSIADIKVERRLGYGTDEEVVRVISNSPKWNPGIQDGKPVRVKFNIPVAFNLAKKEEKKTDSVPTPEKKD